MKSTLKQNKKKNFNKTSLKHPTKFQLIYFSVIGLCNKKKKRSCYLYFLYTCISVRNQPPNPSPQTNPTNKLYNMNDWMERSKKKRKDWYKEVVTKRSESNMNNWLLEFYGLWLQRWWKSVRDGLYECWGSTFYSRMEFTFLLVKISFGKKKQENLI